VIKLVFSAKTNGSDDLKAIISAISTLVEEIGKSIDTYRKASMFWTRNPKLVNPVKKRRIWVQVAKNFEPHIRLTEEEVKQELFDFDEKFTFKASELGSGNHKISAEVFASWQKHDYVQQDSIKNNAKEIQITIN